MFKHISVIALITLSGAASVSFADVNDASSKQHCSAYAKDFIARQDTSTVTAFQEKYGYTMLKFATDGCNKNENENENKFKIVISGADSTLIGFCSNSDHATSTGSYGSVLSCVEKSLAKKT